MPAKNLPPLTPAEFKAFKVLFLPAPESGATPAWVSQQLALQGIYSPPDSVATLLAKVREKDWVSREFVGKSARFAPEISLEEGLAILLRSFADSLHLTTPEDLRMLKEVAAQIASGG